MNDVPGICSDCGCELEDGEETFCEDCLYADGDDEFSEKEDDE